MSVTELTGRHLDIADPQTSTGLLNRWAGAHYGPDATVDHVEPIDGHASIGFEFDVTAAGRTEPLLVRVSADRLRRTGLADAVRQVPVLRAARLHSVPAPEVRWWSDDERWFAQPYFVLRRLHGRSLNPWVPSDVPATSARAVFDQAVTALAAIHRIDWRRLLPHWSPVRTPADEIQLWTPHLVKGWDETRTVRAGRLRDLLITHMPEAPAEPTVVHGNYYSDNWIHSDDRLIGVVDWDLAGIGSPLLDLAWLMLLHDPRCWGPRRQASMTWGLSPGELADTYRIASGQPLMDLDWYRALAVWRLLGATASAGRPHRAGDGRDLSLAFVDEAFDVLVERGIEFLLGSPREILG